MSDKYFFEGNPCPSSWVEDMYMRETFDGSYDHDRCCCECGAHFDGTLECDYCPDCFDKLPDVVFMEK